MLTKIWFNYVKFAVPLIIIVIFVSNFIWRIDIKIFFKQDNNEFIEIKL